MSRLQFDKYAFLSRKGFCWEYALLSQNGFHCKYAPFWVCLVQTFTQTFRIWLRFCADIWTKNRRLTALIISPLASGSILLALGYLNSGVAAAMQLTSLCQFTWAAEWIRNSLDLISAAWFGTWRLLAQLQTCSSRLLEPFGVSSFKSSLCTVAKWTHWRCCLKFFLALAPNGLISCLQNCKSKVQVPPT